MSGTVVVLPFVIVPEGFASDHVGDVVEVYYLSTTVPVVDPTIPLLKPRNKLSPYIGESNRLGCD